MRKSIGSDPAQKLELIDNSRWPGQGDMALVANELYVNYYLARAVRQGFRDGENFSRLILVIFSKCNEMIRAHRKRTKPENCSRMARNTKHPAVIMVARLRCPANLGTAKTRQSSNRNNIVTCSKRLHGAYQRGTRQRPTIAGLQDFSGWNIR